MQRHVYGPQLRPSCPDLEPDCFERCFCEAQRCAVELRQGLTGELAHCPVCGAMAVATYRAAVSPAERPRAA